MHPEELWLGTARRELASAQRYLTSAQAQGIERRTWREHLRGHPVMYPDMTLGDYYQWQMDVAQREITRLTRCLRVIRVQERLARRYLARLDKRVLPEPGRRQDPPWLSPMGVDEVIEGRRIRDRG